MFLPLYFHLSLFQFPHTRISEISISFNIPSFLFQPFSFSVPIYNWIRNFHLFPCSFLSISTFLFFSSHIRSYLKFPYLSIFLPFSFNLSLFKFPYTMELEISMSFPVPSFIFPTFSFFISHIHVNQKFPCLSHNLHFYFHLSLFQFPHTRISEIAMSVPIPSFLFPLFSFSVPTYAHILNFHIFPYSFLSLSTFLFQFSRMHVSQISMSFPIPSFLFPPFSVSVHEYACIWIFHVFLWFFLIPSSSVPVMCLSFFLLSSLTAVHKFLPGFFIFLLLPRSSF